MAKDFPDPGMFAHKPPSPDEMPAPMPAFKIVPTVPARQTPPGSVDPGERGMI